MIKSGELVTIKDSAYDGMNSLTIHGNTRQNLFITRNTQTSNGLTASLTDEGVFTFRGTYGGTSELVSLQTTLYSLKPGTKYIMSIDKAVNVAGSGPIIGLRTDVTGQWAYQYRINGANTTAYFTTPETLANCDVGFVVSPNSTFSSTYRVMLREATPEEVQALASMPVTIPEGGTEDIPQDYPMLLANSSDDLDWCPPGLNSVGDGGSVEVVTAGKNIAPESFNGAKFTAGNSTSVSGKPTYYLPGKTLTASFYKNGVNFHNANMSVCAAYLKTEGDSNNFLSLIDTEPTKTVPKKYGEIEAYCYFNNLFSNEDCIVSCMIEIGTAATDYEPSRTKQTSIDLQGHKLCSLPDGTRDELRIERDGRVTLTNRVGHIDSYSSESIGDYFVASDLTADGTPATGATVIYKLDTAQTVDLGTVDLPALRKLLVNNIWVADDTPATIDVDYNRYRSGCDGFRVDGKHNYWDMRACLASRDAGVPDKKLSTVTVPYMSGFYDLSKLYGAVSFESREVSYTMEFVEDTTEELQRRKSDMLQWLAMVHDADIYDDDYPGYHFHGSYSESEWEEDESGHQGSLTVTFLCQPFLIADDDTSVSVASGEHTVTVEGQPVNAYASCASGSATIKFRGVQQSVSTTPVRLAAQLQPGDNDVTVSGSTVTLVWQERHV